jgi:hypothetical protein
MAARARREKVVFIVIDRLIEARVKLVLYVANVLVVNETEERSGLSGLGMLNTEGSGGFYIHFFSKRNRCWSQISGNSLPRSTLNFRMNWC